MLQTYATSGQWISNNGWSFAIDEEKGGRLLVLESTTSIEELKNMVSEEYEIDQRHVMIECSFLPEDLVKSGSPPVFITTDRQVKNFAAYVMRKATVQLCVTFKPRVHGSCNKEPTKSGTFIGSMGEKNKSEDFDDDDSDPVLLLESTEQQVHRMDQQALDKVVKKGQHFETKGMLKSVMEMCAMRHNFDYKVIKSDTIWWNIRCSDNICNWRLRAVSVQGSEVFKITKYVSRHTCAPSNQKNGGKTASAKTIAKLIMPKYWCSKVGPSPINVM